MAPVHVERRIAAALGVLLFVSYAYFFQGGGWNPNSRLDLTRAVAERGTVTIDDYVANTGDWAQHGGHYYANKAPGLSFATVPMWLATGALLPASTSIETRAWWSNAVVNGGLAALLGVVLFFAIGSLGVSSIAMRAAATLAYGLGTLAFPYATAFYAHQPAAALAFIGFATLNRAQQRVDRPELAVIAGIAAGSAVLFETSTAIVVLALAGWLAAGRDLRRLGLFALGVIPMALLLSWYGWAAFHDPLARWTDWANPRVEVRVNGALFGLPTLHRLWALTLSGYRGVLFTSPVLALAAVGWPAFRRAHPGAAYVCAGIVAAFGIMVASFHAWHGGWAPGPRYLIPCLPFAAVPLAYGIARFPRIGAVMTALSIAVMTAITLVAVEIPKGVAVPVSQFVAPFLLEGRVSVNPQGLDEYLPDPGYAAMNPPENRNSRNLGELLFPGRLASAVPLALVWVTLGFFVLQTMRRGEGPPGRTV
jgi:hypothetical protein